MQPENHDHTASSMGVGKALKRRGIFAAAGAVVAGIVAKQVSQPVMAVSFVTLGGDKLANTATSTTEIWDNSSTNTNAAFAAIRNTFGGSTDTPTRTGIITSAFGTGAVGINASGFGSGSTGIFATGDAAGISASSITIGVQGLITGSAANTIAVYGVNQSAGLGGVGVYGASNTGSGVIGVTYGSGGLAGVYGTSTMAYGMIGSTTAAGYSGLTAITGTAGVAALAATATVNTAYAAYFQGATVVQGDFVAFGGVKSAAVKDASGQHRLVYCVESPEAWFEDFGTGTLVNGRAGVQLDPVFTQIARTDDYHVFLTEHRDHHLHVSSQTTGGFTVEADVALAALKGKKVAELSGSFSYRVVAKRQDIKGERLAKFDLPKIRIPDESKLPKPSPPQAVPSPLPVKKP